MVDSISSDQVQNININSTTLKPHYHKKMSVERDDLMSIHRC